jgi:CO/xanthine dehydrogenase Mo-binding subunit
MVSQRLAGVPMENNGVVAVPEDGALTMWLSHQAPHSVHGAYAPMLGLEPGQLRIVCPWVGGGFGPKAAGYVEHLIAGKAALTLGRPVKWVESRSEDMVSLVHGRDYVMTARLGVNNDGKIVGLDSEVIAAAGAYPAIGAILPMLTQMMSVGVYEVPKVRYDAKTVVTNNTTVGAYRGAGRPEATQLIERVLDVAADQIGIDPAEIRRRNFMQPETFPRTTITGANYDSGEYARALDAALQASGYDDLRAEQAARRASGDTKQIGIGVSSYVEVTAPVGLHVEWGACEVNADGSATVFAGTSVHGQGHWTAFAMLASDVLGIPMDKITLVNSDTSRAVPARSAHGHCRPPAAPSTWRPKACSSGPRRSPPTCWRRRPTTSSSATAACRWPVCRPTRCRGRSSPPPRAISRSCPTMSSLARSDTSSTSTEPTRLSRSGPMCPSSRSTPRPAASRCCATSPSMTAVASSTRCWFGASSTGASPRALRRRCTST